MRNLFYSPKEKLAFYIPGYYPDGTGMLDTLIENLQKERANFIEMVGETKKTIYSSEISTSRRYKSMRYFSVECETCPKNAFDIGDDWTMWRWITN